MPWPTPPLFSLLRSGVIAALLAAAGRLGAQEAEAAAALWAAAGSSGGSGAASPLEALLTLDTTTQLGAGGGRWALGGGRWLHAGHPRCRQACCGLAAALQASLCPSPC